MRHGIAPPDNRPPGQALTSQPSDVKGVRHDKSAKRPYSRDMASRESETGQRLASTLKTRRVELGWTQERLADEAEVARQTVIRYESGDAFNPEPTALRRIWLALRLDLRLILVDLGYATREELDMPVEPEQLPFELDVPVGYWRATSLAEPQRRSLLRHVWAAMELWADSNDIKLPKPPSAKKPTKAVKPTEPAKR